MKYRVQIARQAQEQIEEASDYIARDSPEAAQRWSRTLRERIAGLKTFPYRYGTAPEAEDIGIALRQMIFGSYRVLYTVSDDMVDIISVRHAARRPLEPGELI